MSEREYENYWTREELAKSKAKSIKAKCWDCVAYRGTAADITPAECTCEACPLHAHRPMGSTRPLTLAQRAKRAEEMRERGGGFARKGAEGEDELDILGEID